MWDRQGQVITGQYLGVPYRGIVRRSRVKYGGQIQHTVDLIDEIIVCGSARYTILVDEGERFIVTEDTRIA
jgi:hypothetical protein